MADEFIKGLSIATCAGFAWMVLSGWYTTPGFEDTQLIGEVPTGLDMYGSLAIILREAFFWFAILGMLFFWVIIPGIRQLRLARQ
ncbi:hypothetical protein SAMN05421858_1066 [Haladaptatus litoreus]|uniref:DUF7314 domain-containing protein n=2 Tax=Haladaptatus TaxID=367188 RepID=A0A1N6XB31_9EURY|nr:MULTISPECIES: hypothetical protein [Haladaptatus]SIQ99568.1 hypothetical protein SAMN05421858_1066 [Haladaptatus litoreus]